MVNVNVESEIKRLIVRDTNLLSDESEIYDNSDLIVDFGFDSISIIDLVVDIENTFDIEFDDEALLTEMISQYSKLKEYVVKKITDKEKM